MHFVVKENQDQRLDVFLHERLPELSRSFIQKLDEHNHVTVNGEHVKSGYKLSKGDRVEVDYDANKDPQIPSLKLKIIYQDQDCVVINKPAGVLTHSKGAFNPEATVATWLHDKLIKEGLLKQSQPVSERFGIAHRLDRATSGVMICAQSEPALSWLQKQFSQRKVKKTYLAVIEGQPKQSEAIIDVPIERNPKAPATFRAGSNGKTAQTVYKVKQKGKRYTLLELSPMTGRTHQLRVHLAFLGHPIVGDQLYGGSESDRLYLHALSLELTLLDKKRHVFTSPIPKEFEKIVKYG